MWINYFIGVFNAFNACLLGCKLRWEVTEGGVGDELLYIWKFM